MVEFVGAKPGRRKLPGSQSQNENCHALIPISCFGNHLLTEICPDI